MSRFCAVLFMWLLSVALNPVADARGSESENPVADARGSGSENPVADARGSEKPLLKIMKSETELSFHDGDKVVAKYVYAGTVALEKAAGTKPLAKPYFYPLIAPNRLSVTRPWPMVRGTAGETTDHFHQKSAWFCHGDVIPTGIELKTKSSDKRVHGVDFWSEGAGHGRIVCVKVGEPEVSPTGEVSILTVNEWRTPDDVVILNEDRTISFTVQPQGYTLALHIRLTTPCGVTFGDTKEGSMGIRIRDEFTLMRKDSTGTLASADGKSHAAPAKDNLTIWGQPAKWHDYSGKLGELEGGIAIFDHARNPHPAAWHSRAYGLMAANPFGRADSGFPSQKGKTELVKLAKGETLELNYALYTHNGNATTGQVAQAYAEFVKAKK
jgi:Methane oxygenase PmoA